MSTNPMFIKTPTEGYAYSQKAIAKIAEHYKSKYMGFWAIKSGRPVDVFYQPNPDFSKGHSNYFGMYQNHENTMMITNAESAFSEPIIGLLTEDGEVIVSRYRHHCVVKGPHMIDGGRDYLRTSSRADGARLVEVTVKDGEFQFKVCGDANT